MKGTRMTSSRLATRELVIASVIVGENGKIEFILDDSCLRNKLGMVRVFYESLREESKIEFGNDDILMDSQWIIDHEVYPLA
jgi:hypothetical protein